MMPTITLLFLALAPPAPARPLPPPIMAVPVAPPPVLTVVPPAILKPTRPPVSNLGIVRPPQPRRPAQEYVRAEDYPASALARREEGRVAFTLDVGPDGRVHGCTITRSSGSSALDSATCRLMRSRARFTPAIDRTGSPAPATISDEIVWRLPATTERG